ncbi:unnamed protein product [Prorocentrum cordatum]|uniref:Uncharacterized protein n=1 Tax=Prorocentrum cordatum TaxID=2364126 RepID=A0ABN9XMQ2_9DINO|nr:unnamed protein product [Polarella glacialis]
MGPPGGFAGRRPAEAGCPACRSCTGQPAGPEAERCVFCHLADGTQYVPTHFEGTEPLPFGPGLAAHCACAACWAAWVEQQARTSNQRRLPSTQGRSGPRVGERELESQDVDVSCPVCQRRVDVCQGCPAQAGLCGPCLERLVLPRGKLPRLDRCGGSRRACCRAPFWCMVAVAVIAWSGAAYGVNALMRRLLARVAEATELDGFDLPSEMAYLVCPALGLLGGVPYDPFLRALVEVGERLCRGSRARGRRR